VGVSKHAAVGGSFALHALRNGAVSTSRVLSPVRGKLATCLLTLVFVCVRLAELVSVAVPVLHRGAKRRCEFLPHSSENVKLASDGFVFGHTQNREGDRAL